MIGSGRNHEIMPLGIEKVHGLHGFDRAADTSACAAMTKLRTMASSMTMLAGRRCLIV